MSGSQHLAQIPEAVRIAASLDSSIDPSLKQQAIEYLGKVKELWEETWQDCLSLYLQGAGAAGPSSASRDGKQKLNNELRVFCEQVVDTALSLKPTSETSKIPSDVLQSTYNSVLEFVKNEWVEGPCESGQTFFRNKLSTTIALLFLLSYQETTPTFLHPFFTLLNPPQASSSSAPNFHPVFLSMRLLSDIALEIHDPTMKGAREWNDQRSMRDGIIRGAIRSRGDEKTAVEGLIKLARTGLDHLNNGNKESWLDVVEQSLKTLATWTPWVDIATSLTPETLAFYRQLLNHDIFRLRIPSAAIYRSFAARGINDPAERLQVYRILDIVAVLDPLESSTRGNDDPDVVAFRAAIGNVLAVFGAQLVTYLEDSELPENIRNEAESMMASAIPLTLRFLSDAQSEVALSIQDFISAILRRFKSIYKQKPATLKYTPPPPPAISPEVRSLLSSILDTSVRQLEWPEDTEWEPPGTEDFDPDDEGALLRAKRMMCGTFIESISAIDKSLHTEVVARIVMATLESLQNGGTGAVSWQKAELALHLVYTFGEMNKNNTRAAFFELPQELLTKAGKDRVRRISINKAYRDSEMASGRTTPTSDMTEDALAEPLPGVYYGGPDRIDYEKYPLTPLGQLLTLCMTSGIAHYPHPSVTLQYFEIGVRYVDFWKAKGGSVQPLVEAMIGDRGVHHSDEDVRRRCFYLFTKFIKDCKTELETSMVSPILNSLKDVMVISAVLPTADNTDEDVLLKATSGKTYFHDQLHLFEAAGNLVQLLRSDADSILPLLEAIAGPLMSSIGEGLQNAQDPEAVLRVHHNLMALGHFAKGFPQVSDAQTEELPYKAPFKQMTEALLQALDVMKTQRVVRDAARFAFSQFVNAIGSTVAELVPRFVERVAAEFESTELIDFLTFLNLLMHRLKSNTFNTIDMLLLPLLSRIFAVLQSPITGTDDRRTHDRLKNSYLSFFTNLMNSNLDGVFITERNKPEFENVLKTLLNLTREYDEHSSQRLAFAFFSKSVIAWGTSPAAATEQSVFADSAMSEKSKAVANGTSQPTNQHAIPKADRAAQALPGYETFIYQSLLPISLEIAADPKFNIRGQGLIVLSDIAILIRSIVQARGQEAVDVLSSEMLPKLNCPQEYNTQLIQSLKTQQAKEFRKTFTDYIKAVRR